MLHRELQGIIRVICKFSPIWNIQTALQDTYLVGTTPTALQNEFATCRHIYYDKENQVMIHQLVNDFYTRFLFKIDSLPQELGSPLDITATFFNNLSPNVRDLLISEGVQVPKRLTTETNHQGKQRLILVRNTAVELWKNIISIKESVQPTGVSLHHRKLMIMHRGIPSIKTAGLISSFQSEGKLYGSGNTGGLCISFSGSDLWKSRGTVTNGIHGIRQTNLGIRKYILLDVPETFIFTLPDWHQQCQVVDWIRMHECGWRVHKKGKR